MEIINIVTILIGVFAFSRVFLRYRESKINFGEFVFWSGIWLGAMCFALFPDIIHLLSNKAGFQRGMDLILAISTIVLYYLMFRAYVKHDEFEQKLTKVVREIAIKRAK
ncbi:DUF2304 family protein [Candidatus Woesearchaeota archaeon]|nr:DUF2304 family protein [Candidatus Woesearchaeota archaeon]